MRGAIDSFVLIALLGALGAACGDASTSKISPKGANAESGDDSSPARGGDDQLTETNGGSIVGDDPSTTPTTSDDDGDGVANADDCDPLSKTLGRRIAQDDLSADKGLFAPAAGFPAASWSFGNIAAYQQTRLADASDVAFFSKESNLGDVQVEVAMESTEVSSAITPRLRQIFILVGATLSAGTFSAHACGIEVVQGEMPEQKTSVVKLEGPAGGAIATTVLQRVTRPAVQTNEDLKVTARLEGGVLSCSVAQVNNVTTTASAGGLGALTGSVGLFTRQTKALFKNLRVCGLK